MKVHPNFSFLFSKKLSYGSNEIFVSQYDQLETDMREFSHSIQLIKEVIIWDLHKAPEENSDSRTK